MAPLLIAVCSIAVLAIGAASASAAVVHRYISSFDGADTPAGPLGGLVISEAVEQTSGAVYVTESNAFELGKGVVDKFDENGAYAGVQITGAETPQGAFAFSVFGSGVAVDNSLGIDGGDVYVADTEHGVVDRFSSTGAYLCQITGSATPSASECNGPIGSGTPGGSIEPTGVTVNASGDVYVADIAHAVIDEFGSAGNYVGQISDPHLTSEMGSIALNSAGDIYVTNRGANVVEFNDAGSFASVLEEGDGPQGIAVDPATSHIYVSGNGVVEYDSAGSELDSFGQPRPGHSIVVGVAVRGSTGKIYETEPVGGTAGGEVSIYGPGLVVPTVNIEPATNISDASATLNGHVDPDSTHGGGEITECVFEYGTSTAYGQSAPCAPAAPIASATAVSANVSVAPSTTYHFRLKAVDAGGFNESADETFTTSGPAAVEGEEAQATTTGAMVRAQVDPFAHDTTCQVQYVDDADFNSSGYAGAASVPCVPADLGSGLGDRVANATLTGLQIGTTYHYRYVATNNSGTTDGEDRTFATFGIQSFAVESLDANGQPDTQAGSHPYKLVTSFKFSSSRLLGQGSESANDADLKDVQTELPPGLVGNVNATPKCTRSELKSESCSGATQVGVFRLSYFGETYSTGLYNLVPPPDMPAEFGANISSEIDIYIDANVQTGGEYRITAGVLNASTAAGVKGVTVELWGVPAEASHDAERQCPNPGSLEAGPCAAGVVPQPFLTNPTLCGGPQTATLRTDAWQDPGVFVNASSTLPALTGCGKLDFPPSITTLPDTRAADTPSGVSVDLRVPRSNETPESLATPSLKDAVVTLPAGVTLNPADANGLEACSPAQIALHSPAEATCPDASKVGSVEIETPLLTDKLLGSVYLAEQDNNPFGSLLALYVTAAAEGALIKVAGKVEANPLTGQLTASFDDNPQLPFSDFRLHFFGGARAPLTTPSSCGTYTTTASLTPWSAPESGPPATPSFSFQIASGPVGGPCAPQGFAPGFTAGTTSNQAGGFTPFALSMTRNDGEQNLGTVSTKMPPGVVGMLSKVPLCDEAQANAGICSAASQIGHVTVGVGTGPYPLQTPPPGKPQDPVYLTGPYKGAPFGLSIVVPAEAGPFNLDENGKPVVVRAAINVDPTTAQVTVLSDPLPQMLQGIPLDVRLVDVTIDRPEFIVNPTNCEPMQIGGLLTGALGASSNTAVPFQVTNCAALGFKPRFQVSSSGKTSRLNGASLDVKLSYPADALGRDANIHLVKVELPKQLPSRLGTLQKACPDSTFDANPAQCPAASRVGSATARTPILADSLSGPAYFVSHGGAKFPELVVVLQADGVSVDLHGETFISKKGITSSTFAAVPDVPVSSFELRLPEGPFSALAANSNLCKTKLTMPTTFVAQNGVTLHQSTKIAVGGCPKGKPAAGHKAKKKTRSRSNAAKRKADKARQRIAAKV